MSENMTQAKQTSLKELLASLRETNSLLDHVESKLDYLANNTPQDVSKDMESPTGENPTLETLSGVANSIGVGERVILPSTQA